MSVNHFTVRKNESFATQPQIIAQKKSVTPPFDMRANEPITATSKQTKKTERNDKRAPSFFTSQGLAGHGGFTNGSASVASAAAYETEYKPKRRALYMFSLCALLVVSGAYAALTRNTARTVDLPLTVNRSSDVALSGGENTQEVNIEDIPMMQPSDVTIGSFATYRIEMDSVRAESIAMLESIIGDPKSDEATAAAARNEKIALASAMSTETQLEKLIAARGYGESYVTVKTGSVNVVVNNANLPGDAIQTIIAMAAAETGESASNVKVITVK